MTIKLTDGAKALLKELNKYGSIDTTLSKNVNFQHMRKFATLYNNIVALYSFDSLDLIRIYNFKQTQCIKFLRIDPIFSTTPENITRLDSNVIRILDRLELDKWKVGLKKREMILLNEAYKEFEKKHPFTKWKMP